MGIAQAKRLTYNRAMKWFIPFIAICLITLVSCTSSAEVATPVQPLATPTATPTTDPDTTPQPIQLTIWFPDWMVLDNPNLTTSLENTFSEFESRYGATIELMVKPQSGPGGLLDALQKTKAAAPVVLPDLVVLSFHDVAIAAEQDLAQPLDDLLPNQIKEDLFPFAQEVAQVEDSWLSLPFTADMEHLAFQPSALSDPPLNWGVLLESNAIYAFPAEGPETSLTDAQLIHYLSAVDDGANPVRNEQALRKTLAFYESAKAKNIIDESTLQASRPEDTWDRALQGEAHLAHTTFNLWLKDQEQTTTLRFGPIPTSDSSPRYIADGWAYVLVSADPAKQEVLARLLETLLEPEALATWSNTARRLPTRRAALAQWPRSAYSAFATEALEIAIVEPNLLPEVDFVRSLHKAFTDVLSGNVDAETAAQTAIETW